jgi:hypothetical protein
MHARLSARVALLAAASSLWACGTPSPGLRTAGHLPPSSGLADFHQTADLSSGSWTQPFSFCGGFGPYVPPVMVWGPFSPIPLLDFPGPPVGPVSPLFCGFGFPWGW